MHSHIKISKFKHKLKFLATKQKNRFSFKRTKLFTIEKVRYIWVARYLNRRWIWSWKFWMIEPLIQFDVDSMPFEIILSQVLVVRSSLIAEMMWQKWRLQGMLKKLAVVCTHGVWLCKPFVGCRFGWIRCVRFKLRVCSKCVWLAIETDSQRKREGESERRSKRPHGEVENCLCTY